MRFQSTPKRTCGIRPRPVCRKAGPTGRATRAPATMAPALQPAKTAPSARDLVIESGNWILTSRTRHVELRLSFDQGRNSPASMRRIWPTHRRQPGKGVRRPSLTRLVQLAIAIATTSSKICS